MRRGLLFMVGATVGGVFAAFPDLLAWTLYTLYLAFWVVAFLAIVFAGCWLLDRWARADSTRGMPGDLGDRR